MRQFLSNLSHFSGELFERDSMIDVSDEDLSVKGGLDSNLRDVGFVEFLVGVVQRGRIFKRHFGRIGWNG